MKILYFLMGLLAGVFIGSRMGLIVCDIQSDSFEQEFLAATLVGYSEGWTRGRDYTEGRIYFLLNQCIEERKR